MLPAESESEPSEPPRIDVKTYTPFQQRMNRAEAEMNWRYLFGGQKDDGTLVNPAVGWRYRNCTLDNFVCDYDNQRTVVARLRRFAEIMPEAMAEHGGLLLYGKGGTGKDHLLAALMREAIQRHGLRVAWFDGGRLYDLFADAIASGTLEKFQDRLARPHVLAISDPQPPRDDLTPSQLRRLRDCIDRRYRDGLGALVDDEHRIGCRRGEAFRRAAHVADA